MRVEAFDIVVVGGGPAGSSTALHLATAQGIDPRRILVLDKARHPREKPCAGAVSAAGVDVIRELGLEVAVPYVSMEGLRVLCGGARGGHLRAGLGVVVRRDEFDGWLLRAAATAGVVVRDGEGVTAVVRSSGGFVLTTPRGQVTTQLLAACDGTGSVVRKELGVAEAARKGHLYVLETAPGKADGATLEGLCDFDLDPVEHGLEGYYWDFPTVIAGARAVSRGIYHANFHHQPHVKATLEAFLRKRGVDPAAVRFKPFSTRPFVPGSTLQQEGVAFVGEAAGIDATTGEGIAQALVMGRLAAKALARALRLGTRDMTEYDGSVRRSRVGRHLLQSAWLAPRVYGPRGGAARRFLARSPSAWAAGAEWYAGQPLGPWRKARLAAGLAASFAAHGFA